MTDFRVTDFHVADFHVADFHVRCSDAIREASRHRWPLDRKAWVWHLHPETVEALIKEIAPQFRIEARLARNLYGFRWEKDESIEPGEIVFRLEVRA